MGGTISAYRIYCELELNLRIKPKKRLKRDKPEPLSVPERPNETWSMDFMADRHVNFPTDNRKPKQEEPRILNPIRLCLSCAGVEPKWSPVGWDKNLWS